MTKNLYWLQAAGCGGDTMSLLNSEAPDFVDEFNRLKIKLIWHPSLSCHTEIEHQQLLRDIRSSKTSLDILCVEGSILLEKDSPQNKLIIELAELADFVIAVGTCASFGGVTAACQDKACGLQFRKQQLGGLLGSAYTSRKGQPVINLAGCPCHPQVILGTINALMTDIPLTLTEFNMPQEWYKMLVHQGCTRNEYHEFRVEEKFFGEKGCLFFFMGCRGPLTYGPCNKLLWNRRNSKTRAGVPCFGCTSPDFPQSAPLFKTNNIEGVPLELPEGMSRAHYLAYKSMAAAAAPERLKKRETDI